MILLVLLVVLATLGGCAGISAKFRDPESGASIFCNGLDQDDPVYKACVDSLEKHGYERKF